MLRKNPRYPVMADPIQSVPSGSVLIANVAVPVSFPGKTFGSKVVLSLCSRRGLVDELPLVRGHDKEVLPDMRFTDCELLGP